MPLHPHVRARLHVFDDLGPETSMADLGAAMARFEQDPEPWSGSRLTVERSTVEGPHGAVPVRTYAPEQAAAGVLLWLHGGAFFAGDLDMPESDMVASLVAERAGIAVVTADYRLARGGVRFPVPLDDSYAAWRWVVEELGAGSARVEVGGASAGASLAAGCLLLDRERGAVRTADRLLLAYPFLHHPLPAPSAALSASLSAELPSALRFDPDFVDFVMRNYVGRIYDVPTTAAPGQADLRGLPPVRVVVAEYDDLRPSGELLQRQLLDAGVEVDLRLAEGMPHGYLNRSPSLAEVAETVEFLVGEGRTQN